MMRLSKGATRSLLAVAAFSVVVLLVYNLWDGRKTLAVLNFGLRYSIPLILAAMAGLMCERTGVVNIGIEGQMLAAAFAGFFMSAAFGVWVGIIGAIVVGFLTGVFLALCAVRWKIDQIIAGTVINTMAAGFTSFFYKQGRTLQGRLPQFEFPGLSKIPIIGPLFFRELGPLAWFAIILVFIMHVLVFRTRWGLRSRAVGEHPSAADTVGIGVERLRYMNTSIAGALAGMAGAFIAIESSGSFSRGMTNGRGFLALAIVIMGRWRPMLAAASAVFFGLMFGITNQLQFDKVIDIPPQLISMTPYVLTIVVLAVFSGRVRPPAAAGTPYVKE
jgi:general nucleoside transport system permease protein